MCSGSARLTSFEINFISKETSRTRPEYMNIHPPPINALATVLQIRLLEIVHKKVFTVNKQSHVQEHKHYKLPLHRKIDFPLFTKLFSCPVKALFTNLSASLKKYVCAKKSSYL